MPPGSDAGLQAAGSDAGTLTRTMDGTLDTAELRALLRTLGARSSRSAEAARAQQIEEIRALSVEERMILALRLGKRDRAVQQAAASGGDRATGAGRGGEP